MQKVKDDFQQANKEILSGNVYMIQNCFTLFIVIHILINVLTVNCMQYSERICCNSDQTRSQSCNEINTHRTLKKHNNLLQLKRSYLVLNEEQRKQERKASRIITLVGGNDKKVKYL